jgi:hypothetical protein
MYCPLKDPRRIESEGDKMDDANLSGRCNNVRCPYVNRLITNDERPKGCMLKLLTDDEAETLWCTSEE